MTCRWLLLTICWLSLYSHAQTVPTAEQMWETYQAVHAGSVEVNQANEITDRYFKNHPGDALAMAYKGSFKTLQARQASHTWLKLSLINEGFNFLDQSISTMNRAGDSLSDEQRMEILTVNGLTNASVPKAFGRRTFAERDLGKLLEFGRFGDRSRPYQAKVLAWYAVAVSERSVKEGQKYLIKARALDEEIAKKIWDKR